MLPGSNVCFNLLCTAVVAKHGRAACILQNAGVGVRGDLSVDARSQGRDAGRAFEFMPCPVPANPAPHCSADGAVLFFNQTVAVSRVPRLLVELHRPQRPAGRRGSAKSGACRQCPADQVAPLPPSHGCPPGVEGTVRTAWRCSSRPVVRPAEARLQQRDFGAGAVRASADAAGAAVQLVTVLLRLQTVERTWDLYPPRCDMTPGDGHGVGIRRIAVGAIPPVASPDNNGHGAPRLSVLSPAVGRPPSPVPFVAACRRRNGRPRCSPNGMR
eukprot:gene16724-biopygen2266